MLLVGVGCTPGASDPEADAGSPAAPLSPEARAKAPDSVLDALARGEPQEILLALDEKVVAREAPHAGDEAAPGSPEEAALRAALFAAVKGDVLAAAPLGVTLVQDYDQLPLALVRVESLGAMGALLGDHRVAAVFVNEAYQHTDDQSFALINQPKALADGKDGSGTAVAVIDTGCDYTNAAFGACTEPGMPAEGCKVAFARDFAPDDGQRDDSGHGTNVSGIVSGVAPGARILALDVFSGAVAWSSDVLSAINWVIANQSVYHIAAMNLSLGGGRHTAPCGSSPLATAIAAARGAGVIAAIASGNDGWSDSTLAPACVPGAVSVGAVYDGTYGPLTWSAGCTDKMPAADVIPCFSNSAPWLSVLAPGAQITAAGLTYGGTSQAAPHVAGALAVLRAAFPAETADEIVARITYTGKPITDARNRVTVPRLDLGAAATGCIFRVTPPNKQADSIGGAFSLTLACGAACNWSASAAEGWITFPNVASGTGPSTIDVLLVPNGGPLRSGTITVTGDGAPRTIAVSQGADTAPPSGSLTINGGAAATRATTVALAVTADDPSGVTEMCISNAPMCATFVPYAAAKTWTLASDNGARTVYVFLRDGRGNTSSAASALRAMIVLDTVVPTNGMVTGESRDGQVALGWNGFADALSGVASYRVVGAAGMPPASCAGGEQLYAGAALEYVHGGLTNGSKYGYRVCAIDGAGNVSTGAVATVVPRPESNPPMGGVTINNGAAFTKSTAVTLTLSATDDTSVAQMCISLTPNCGKWESYATTRAMTLAAGGSRTVYAWFMDPWGNATAQPATATIVVDTIAPTNGSVTAIGSAAQVALSWKGFADTGSGVAGYKVVFAEATPPASCAAGTEIYSGPDLGMTHANLVDGTTYGYRVCAIDGAGNVSLGAVAKAIPAPEYDPPAGSVTINGGAAFTRDPVVTLSLPATDASGVASMCIGSNAGCVNWEKYADTKVYTLVNAPGVRTVYVLYRDPWGNTTPRAATAQILLDNVAPTGGTVKAVAGDGQVSLSWNGFADALTGVAGYRVVAAAQVAPPNCASGRVVYDGNAAAVVDAGLTNGEAVGYRACAVDGAGNVSLGVTAVATPAPEFVPPVGHVVINGGGALTRSTAVQLTLDATDASGVAAMCISNTNGCNAWEAFAADKVFTLTNVQGAHTVYAFFRDTWGNASQVAATAQITLDSVAPTMAAFTATQGSQQIALAWQAAWDTGSGLAGYTLVFLPGNLPPAAACTTGTQIYADAGLAFVHTGLTAGAVYSYRLCALDVAGNTSAGVVKTAAAGK